MAIMLRVMSRMFTQCRITNQLVTTSVTAKYLDSSSAREALVTDDQFNRARERKISPN